MSEDRSYCKKSPCANCPYRTDAPLRHWSVEEFANLLESEKEEFGRVFGCHKKDGHVCVGWLMDQDRRNHPSIALRLSLLRHKVTRQYLDALKSKSPLYASIELMVAANFPELLT